MELDDKIILDLDNQVTQSLSIIVSSLNAKADNFAKEKKIDYLLLAYRGLCSYSEVLFQRIISYQNSPIEFLAITSRNIFEIYLHILYISQNNDKAKDFICQKFNEDLEINDGFLSLTTPKTSKISIEIINERKNHIKNIMDINMLSPSKRWVVKSLATKTDNAIEYDAFYKLYSKFIHPSSWIVNSQQDEYDNFVFRNMFLFQAEYYSNIIVKVVSNYLNEPIDSFTKINNSLK